MLRFLNKFYSELFCIGTHLSRNHIIERNKTYNELEKETLKEIFGVDETNPDYSQKTNLLRTYLNMHLEKSEKTRLPLEI